MKELLLTINDRQVKGRVGDSVLDVCRANGIDVPTLCHLDGLSDVGGCRMCIVEIEKERKPVPSCTYPAREGLVVRTHTERLERYRRLILELFFTERSHFCMYCEKSGDCELQRLAYRYQMDHVRLGHGYRPLPLDALSDTIVIDHNRCTLCGRCVRACREIAGTCTLDFGGRGWNSRVVADLAQPLGRSSCTSCGACLQACPTGAIFSKPGLYKGVAADCEHVSAVCPSCGVGCRLDVLVKDNHIVRIDAADLCGPRGPLCREGRFGLLREHRRRITAPLMRNDHGELEECSLERAAEVAARRIAELKGRFAGMVSSRLPLETLSFFESFIRNGVRSDWVDTTDGHLYRLIRQGMAQLEGNGKGLEIECSLDEILRADCLLVVGADPVRTHPVVASLIQRATSRCGARLLVIDPSRSTFPLWADLWLKAREGTEGILIASLARIHLFSRLLMLEKDGPESLRSLSRQEMDQVAGATGIDTELLEAAARMYGDAHRAVIIYGEGLLETRDPSTVASLLNLATVTGSVTGDSLRVIFLKPGANSRGSWEMGLASKAIDWQEVKGLYLMLGDDREDERLLETLRGVDFLVVQASHESPATSLAHVVLPSLTWAERAGTFVSMDGSVSESRHAIEPPLRDREIFDAVSKALGHELSGR